MAKFRGVPPSRQLERSYYLDMKRHFLDPYLASLSGRLSALGPDASVDDWIRESEDAADEWSRETGPTGYDYIDRRTKDIATPGLVTAMDEMPGQDPGGSFRGEILALLDEFIEYVENAPDREMRSSESLIEMLERKVVQMTRREELIRRFNNVASATAAQRAALRDKGRDAVLNYLRMWVSYYGRWARMITEVHGIAFRGGEGTQTTKILTDVLWDFRTKMDLWTAAIQKIDGYMTRDGMRRLMVEMITYYSELAIKEIVGMVDDFVTDFAGRVRAKLETWEQALLRFQEYLTSGAWMDDVARVIIEHLRGFGARAMRIAEILKRLYGYTRQGGWEALIDDLLQRYSMEWFAKWTTLKRYINFDEPELDLDLLYKDYLKPYFDRAEAEWDKWKARTRFVDLKNREIDLDILFNDLFVAYFTGVYARWQEVERKWGILKSRVDKVGFIGVIEDAIDFGINKLEARASVAAASRFSNFVEPFVMKWIEKLNRHTQAATAKDFIRVAKVDIRPRLRSAAIAPALREGAIDSINLIKTIPRRFHDDLSRKLIKGETDAPLDLQARAKMFRKAGKSAGYNLRRITRDQSNKMTSRLTHANHDALGITHYRWETADDDRVRETHAAHDGRVFRWDQPPPDTGHPGEDIQCRCVALPIVSVETLKARHERFKGKKTGEEQPQQALPFIREVDAEEAAQADTELYDVVPVEGEEGKFNLVPKENALVVVQPEKDDDDYGIAKTDIRNVPARQRRQRGTGLSVGGAGVDDDTDYGLTGADYDESKYEKSHREGLDEWYDFVEQDIRDMYRQQAIDAGETVEDYIQNFQDANLREEVAAWMDTEEMTQEEAISEIVGTIAYDIERGNSHNIAASVHNFGRGLVEQVRQDVQGDLDTRRRRKNKPKQRAPSIAGFGVFKDVDQPTIDRTREVLYKIRQTERHHDRYEEFRESIETLSAIQDAGHGDVIAALREEVDEDLKKNYRLNAFTGEWVRR